MRTHKYIVGMRIQGRARDIALQQSLSERVRGKAHEYNCGKPVLLPLSKLSLSLYELYIECQLTLRCKPIYKKTLS
jgi:hypothetical protein